MIRITTRDVGATEAATIWVGDTMAASFYTGTRHPHQSIEIAEEVLAVVIAELLEGKVDIYTGDY